LPTLYKIIGTLTGINNHSNDQHDQYHENRGGKKLFKDVPVDLFEHRWNEIKH
jgi:hypothetical protein